MEQNGVDNVPSVGVMKDKQKWLQQLAGVETRKYKGAFGHTYYVNDIGQIIAQVGSHTSPCDLDLTYHRIGNGQPSCSTSSLILS